MARRTKRVVRDALWRTLAPMLPAHPAQPKGGRRWADDRECLEGILWVARTGAGWQRMPPDLPSGSTCWRRLRDWAGEGLLAELHARLVVGAAEAGALDLSELAADATFVRKKRGADVGKTKCGKGMKLEIVVDAGGLPLAAVTAAANVGETALVGPALDAMAVAIPEGTPILLDKGYDSDRLRDALAERGLAQVTPHRRNRKRPARTDGRRLRRYRRRWVVERTNAWLHFWRRIANRWEFYSFIYSGLVSLVCSVIISGRL